MTNISQNDSNTLLKEFNKKYPEGWSLLPSKRAIVISTLDNIIKGIPSNVWKVFRNYTIEELAEWYLGKRKSGEL